MRPIFTKVIHKLWYVLCAVIILAALLVSMTSLLTPVLNEHRADFEKLASNILLTPVMIGNVKVTWHGYSPEIDLENVTILNLQTQKPKAVIQRLRIDFSIWKSLWTRQAAIRNITVFGVKLTIIQHHSGKIQIGGLTSFNIKDTQTGDSVETEKMATWIFSQPRLALNNIDIHFVSSTQPERFITFRALSLRNDGKEHIIDGRVTLNQELPTNIDVHFAWEGDIRQFQMAKGNFYLYLEGLSLPQWFSKMNWQGFQVRKGLASIKLWAKWQNNQWQKVQSTFQIYGLEAYSSQAKRSENINRISANIGWKVDGNTQILAGDNIYIDFPQHVWPVTNFELTAVPYASGNLALKSARTNYLNLSDVSRIALESALLPDDKRNILTTLDLKGELKELRLIIQNALTDVTGLTLTTQFSQLALNAWENVPGVGPLNGAISWDKSHGNLKLDEAKVFFTLPQRFAKPLYFDQLNADIHLQHDTTGSWILKTKGMSAKNADGDASADLALTFPLTGSPSIDLAANFNVSNATHIIDYLPLKTFDPDLATWLTNAFKSGHVDAGRVIIQGKLSDFPFDNNTGKFLVSTAIHDTTLNFAPGWPMLSHIEGMLTFAGRGMTADVASGQILDVSVKNVRGVIPYIGDDQPQILHVDGVMSGDLQQGLNFIQSSPLQKTIGKDLKSMQLTGPMQLTLSLVVPLKRPSDTTVKGLVGMTEATLNLPDWRLAMTHINGAFDFTENGIEAKHITSTLFDSPATLDMATSDKPGQKGQVRADLSSQINVAQLEKWLEVSLPFAKGASTYQAQLLLSAHDQSKPNQVIISTDLKGISLNAPGVYGKKEEQTKNLQAVITVTDSNAMNAKLDYAKLISAAMTLTKVNNTYQVVGGELRLGSGDASFQKNPGVLVTGQIPQLDWDVWQNYFASFQKKGAASHPDHVDLLRGIDLSVGLVNVGGQQLHQAHLNVTLDREEWLVKINSEELGGDLRLPLNLSGKTIVGHFQHLTVGSPSAKNPNSHSLDPGALPMLSIEIDNVQVGGIGFGHVTLNTAPANGGLIIKQLSINESFIKLNATGDWFGSASHSKSHLQGEVSTPRISEMLNKWGLNSTNFVGSTGNITFNLSWADAPFRPALAGLTGDLSLKLGEGRIVELSEGSDAKMGLGRMLNLFSLSTIPRRLSLNFSDLFEKGYSFDSLTAKFSLRSGSAFTENMRFDGPIASVEIKGRVGLKAKDFDLQLGVTPYVTGSLPLVATIAGGPIAGVATWVVDKVISSQVSRVTTYQYNVRGPWSNPVWTQITGSQARSSVNTLFPFSLLPSPEARVVGNKNT
ncbi:MAG: YhdP family protein [Gammaproteobacteria bacterium]|nr:YhdP family protein [Gammaproteobacteria bacterium]